MKKAEKVIYILLIVILLGIFCYCGFRLLRYYSEGQKTQSGYDELSDLRAQVLPSEDPTAPTIDWSVFAGLEDRQLIELPESPYVTVTNPDTGTAAVMLPEFAPLYERNADVVGWLAIPDTQVSYPVVQRISQRDYYLRRDFYGQDAVRGCLYVREECDVFAPSDNVVIYGHRMQDGSMFGDLLKYKKESFWQDHQYLRFDTLRERHTYQVVCVFIYSSSSPTSFSYHLFNDAADQEEFDQFWRNCQANALYDTGADVTYGDKLLTLSTCEYSQTNGRLVVVAKRVN